MKEKLTNIAQQLLAVWKQTTKRKKWLLIGGFLSILTVSIILSILLTRDHFVPLYSNLSPQEAGQIKEQLDVKGVPYQLQDGGATILVPVQNADALKVELATQGLPNSGRIDYSFFGQNSGFGLTDNEFNVLKLDAMQNELSNLIKGISGIEDAKVMITLPEKSLWVSDTGNEATASVVLKVTPGYNFNETQTQTLYHLISKSVPNLPVENIVVTDQYSNFIDLNNNGVGQGNEVATQEQLRKQIETNLQRRLQQMLGTVMGQDKVMVLVTTDLDFTQEKRTENRVEPVNTETQEGIIVSMERIKEKYSGESTNEPGGTPGTGEGDIPTYGTNGTNGNSEKTEERTNYEMNRIQKEISESPYRVRDLGIQVFVEPPNAEQPESLSQQSIDDIRNVLAGVIRTTIDKSYSQIPLTTQQANEKITVSVQKFNGKTSSNETVMSQIPLWVYIAAGVAILLLIILISVFIVRRRKKEEKIVEAPVLEALDLEDYSEAAMRRKQIEKLAKENPVDFVKILRTWLSEE